MTVTKENVGTLALLFMIINAAVQNACGDLSEDAQAKREQEICNTLIHETNALTKE